MFFKNLGGQMPTLPTQLRGPCFWIEYPYSIIQFFTLSCRSNKNKTVTTAADVLATSVSAEALLLSPTSVMGENESISSHSATTVLMAEAASSPMSPITLASVETGMAMHSAFNKSFWNKYRNKLGIIFLVPIYVTHKPQGKVHSAAFIIMVALLAQVPLQCRQFLF